MIIALKFNRLATCRGLEGAYFAPVNPRIRGARQFISTALMAYMLEPGEFIESAERQAAALDRYEIPTAELKKAYENRVERSINLIDRNLENKKSPLLFSHVFASENGQAARFETPKGASPMDLKIGDVRWLLSNDNIKLKNGRYIPEMELIKALNFFMMDMPSPMANPVRPL